MAGQRVGQQAGVDPVDVGYGGGHAIVHLEVEVGLRRARRQRAVDQQRRHLVQRERQRHVGGRDRRRLAVGAEHQRHPPVSALGENGVVEHARQDAGDLGPFGLAGNDVGGAGADRQQHLRRIHIFRGEHDRAALRAFRHRRDPRSERPVGRHRRVIHDDKAGAIERRLVERLHQLHRDAITHGVGDMIGQHPVDGKQIDLGHVSASPHQRAPRSDRGRRCRGSCRRTKDRAR
jgi:hypothetical protein